MTSRSALCMYFSVLALVLILSSCGSDSGGLVGVQVQPSTKTLNSVGETIQLHAIGTFQKGSKPPSTRDITGECTWISSNAAVATTSSSGLVTAVGSGTATVTASYESSSATGTAQITVTTNGAASRELISIALVPTTQTVHQAGQTAQYIATGTFNSNPVTEDMTTQATWSSSAPQIATVNSTGLVTAVGQGTATISAKATSHNGAVIVGTATFTQTSNVVPPRDLLSISIIPSEQPLETTGETAQFLAVGTFSGPPVTAFLRSDTPPAVTWTSSATQVATIDANGLATAKGKGISTITAYATAASGAVIVGTASLTEHDGPSPTVPLLTIVKLGAGAGDGLVVSDPSPINCGVTCNASFPLGSTVTLTATGSAFRGWSSNCTPVAGTPNRCTVIVGVNTVVGVIFD